MIASFPAVDVHVHVPGTISPRTAWDLGIRNQLITVLKNADGSWKFEDGPRSIGTSDPVGKYSNIFCSRGGFPLDLDEKGEPIDLDYNYACLGAGHDKFSGFDAIQGTTQGHRHRPGGIQTEDDYRFVLQRYLESCLEQNICYSETSQNITIAQVLYPDLPPKEARRKFFYLCRSIVGDFAKQGVILRFYHCANKTGAANIAASLEVRSAEWVSWLREAQQVAPDIFVGLTTAGHEQSEIDNGGPYAMAKAYHEVEAMGLGCEGHYGEGVGVEHMMNAMRCLPRPTRIAHGIQVIESAAAIEQVRKSGVPLIMMPSINISLGGLIHYKDGKPHPKFEADGVTRSGTIKKHITEMKDHPIFTLMRQHNLPIALSSDDPEQGGISYKAQLKELAGITYKFPAGLKPLSAEELVACNLNAVQVAFCEPEVKEALVKKLRGWMKEHKIAVTHPLLEPGEDAASAGESGATEYGHPGI